jgi:excisionase family DNA binding protein
MPRSTHNITAATAAPTIPADRLEVERDALDALAKLDDDAFVEVQIKRPRKTAALFPVGFLRRYLAAQSVPGRQILVFDSDEEVSSQVAADMFGVSRPHLNELLELEAIPYRRVGNQRRVRVLDLHQFMRRRERRAEGLEEIAEVVEESAGGWSH